MKVISTSTNYIFKGQRLDLNVPTEIGSEDQTAILALEGVMAAPEPAAQATGPAKPTPTASSIVKE